MDIINASADVSLCEQQVMPEALVLTQVWYCSVHSTSPLLCSALPCAVAWPHWLGLL